MQAKLLSVLIASACFYSVNGIADTFSTDTAVTFPYLPPDYTITKFYYTPNLTEGTTEINLTLLNQGLTPTSAQRTALYLNLSTGTSPTDSTPLINRKFIDALGNYGSRSYSWTTDTDKLSKNLYATVDPDDFYAESNEDNNSAVAVRQEATGSATVELDSVLSIYPEVPTVDENVDMVIVTSSATKLNETISGLIAVTQEDGSEIYVSDLFGLERAGTDAFVYEGNHRWNATGVAAGTYTVILSVWGETSGKMDEIRETLVIQSLVENNSPIAKDDAVKTSMNVSVDIDIQANDVEPDGNGFIHYISSDPKHGSVEVLRGIATYTPHEGFVGTDHFGYQMNDYLGASDWADVTIDVLPDKHGCTWIRNFNVVTTTERTALDGWSDFELPESGRAEYAALVQGNSAPELFEVQPFISFPSCSLYFQAKPGVTGTATVVYAVLDKASEGQEYTSETRTFDISLLPETALPEFLSKPPTLAQTKKLYSYNVELSATGATLTALELPEFLTLEDTLVSGTPRKGNADVGLHKIVLIVDDGVQSTRQEYLLAVEPEISVFEPIPPSNPLSDDADDELPEPGSAGTDSETSGSDNDSLSGVVQTGGSGGFNPFWLLLSLPLLRRLR